MEEELLQTSNKKGAVSQAWTRLSQVSTYIVISDYKTNNLINMH